MSAPNKVFGAYPDFFEIKTCLLLDSVEIGTHKIFMTKGCIFFATVLTAYQNFDSILKQTFNSLHVAINMAGPSEKSSKIKKKSKTALLLDDDEKAEKAADKEENRQANIVRNAKLEQILARKLNPNAVSPETTAEIPKEVAEKLKIKALKEEQAKQEAEQIELAKKEAEIRNQEFIRKTQEAKAKRRAQFDEQEARKKAKEDSKKMAIKNFDKLPFFEKLGLADEMVLEKIQKYVIIQSLLLLISAFYIFVKNNTNFLTFESNTFLHDHQHVQHVSPTSIGALLLVVFLGQIFKFCKFDTSDYKNDWIEQETRRIHVQSCA